MISILRLCLPVVFGIATILAGCVPQKRVNLTSDPTGAQVTLDGVPLGQTPHSELLTWTTGRDDDVKHAAFRLDGYEEAFLDLKWLPPEQTNFHVNLRRGGSSGWGYGGQQQQGGQQQGGQQGHVVVVGGGSGGNERIERLEERFTRLEILVEKLANRPAPAPPPTSSPSFLDDLERVKKLRESGTLTDAEFDAAKKRLLEARK